jgi:hypothetical protein
MKERVNRAKLRQEFTINYARDWWLKKYHNTTCAEVIKHYPEESRSGAWYKLYSVTQEQHDEWYEWLIGEVMYRWKLSRQRAIDNSQYFLLDASPSVKT